MQNHWTENGWQLLKIVAINAALKSGFESTAEKVIKDAISLSQKVASFPEAGTLIKNIYGEDRRYSVFNNGKVAIWKIKDNRPLFVGAYSSIPEPLVI